MDPEESDPQIDAFAAYFSRVVKFALIAGGVGVVLGICFAYLYITQSKSPNTDGAVAMPMLFGVGFCGMVAGTVLLLAPAPFFYSEKGRQYLDFIGTKSVVLARLVILLFLTMGFIFFAMMAAFTLQMCGIIDERMFR